jgi:hypothetical protein
VAADGVDKPNSDVASYAIKWTRVRDAIAGEAAVHGKNIAYLPKLRDEPDDEYKARRERTTWYNATARTHVGLHGMLFRKDPQIVVPAGIESLLDDVTLTGVPFVNFVKEIGSEILGPGIAGVLIDHPQAPDLGATPLTVKIAESMGLRPTMALYKCETFLDWKFRRINNKWTLSQVRLKECVKQDKSEFEQNEIEQIRVLDLDIEAGDTYRVRLYRKDDHGRWVQYGPEVRPLMNNKPIGFIPFLFITCNGVVAELCKPPLNDLVDLNYKHYLVSSDYEHACHFTALPTPWIAGMNAKIDPVTGKEIPQKMYIGSKTAWIFENAEAKVGFLEYSGKGIDAIKENLEGKEAQMAAVGARMLAPEKRGVEAADTIAMRHSGEQSVLSAIANALDLGAAKALEWFTLWAGQSGETDVDINKDFMPVTMDSATLTALVSAWQSGGISEEELFDELQRGDVIKPEKTFIEHKTEIENNPPMGVMAQQASIETMLNPPLDPNKQDAANKKDTKVA